MTVVPTLHLRNVPVEVYERLAARARGNGRSLNAEAVALIDQATRGLTWDEFFAKVDERAKRLGFDETWPAPEDLIREDRDSR